ncbi:MAG: hypothetical protein GX896_00495 [Clostridiales bacterium]|nr:hypothetical protein [Clostridiales bacterium]
MNKKILGFFISFSAVCLMLPALLNPMVANADEILLNIDKNNKHYPTNVKIIHRTDSTSTDEDSSDNKLVDIANSTITLDKTSVDFTGAEIKVGVTVAYDGKTLAKDVDYTISYSNNINAGTANVKITGIGEYLGEKSASFTINKPATVSPPKKLVTTGSTSSSMHLSWTKSNSADGYRIERLNNNNWITCGEAGGTTYADTGLSGATTYQYRVSAFKNYNGTKIYSSSISASFVTNPNKVSNIKASSLTNTSLSLNWSASKNTNLYVVSIHDGKTNTYKAIGNTTGLSYNISGLPSNSIINLRVQSVTKIGDRYYYSNGSNFSIKTLKSLNAVTSLKATSSSNNITISWGAVADATGYEIYYSSSTTGNGTLLKEITSGGTTSYTTSSFPKDKSYNIRVRAVLKKDGGVVTGEYSQWIKKRVFNNINFNEIMKSYTNSKNVTTVNAQGYSISKSKKDALLNALKLNGTNAGFLMYDLESGAVVAYNANTYFGTASTVKLPYMLYALKEMEDGSPNLDTKITYKKEDKHGGAGVIQKSKIGTQYTIKSVFEHIAKYSDNTAYYMLQRTFPYQGYNKYISSLGCRTSINSLTRWGVVSASDSTREWIEMEKYLRTGKYKDFMKTQLSTTIAGYFREGLNRKYTVYSKSGWTENNSNDTALIMAEHPYILVCFTNGTSSYKPKQVARAAEDIHNEMWAHYNK